MISPDLQHLLDRAEIEDVLMRYFNAADNGNKKLVRSCFTNDVWAHYEGREPVRGADALIAQIALFDKLASGACRISTHFSGNLMFKELSREHAETVSNVFSCLVDSTGTTVAIRSLRYLDRLRRERGHWKISVRIHTLDWSCTVPCTFSRAFTQKLSLQSVQWPQA